MSATVASSSQYAVLTTTFTPPAACATQFMKLDIESDQIWMNPITPASGIKATSCYASQWINSYSTAAFSPLVCPSGYQTQSTFASPSNYFACCPTGFDGLALDPSAPRSRPALSATCYTNIVNSAILLTLYDTSSATATKLYTATDPAAQAYAHAYDGYLAAAVDKTLPPTTAATGSSPSSTASNSDSGVSGGTIAEAVIGVIAGLALVAGLLAFLLRRRRRRPAPYTVAEMPGESALGGYGTKENRAEMPANYYVLSELPGSEPTDVKVAAPGADKR